tara:strand:- start:5332 stop:6099 length:768 start_codon:yes stop_codon:yes gene_type:complete
MNIRRIETILKKIFDDKIKENFIILHSSLVPFEVTSLEEVKIFWKILNQIVHNKFTIIMPSFSLRVKKNWYQNRTKSEMGLLTEYFRGKIATQRSIHPLHSVSMYGPHLKLIPKKISSSSFGKNSIWEWLCNRKDVLNISLGMGLAGGATFVHYAEELFKPPYRNLINLKLTVYDHNEKKINKRFSFFARKKNKYYEGVNYWKPVEKNLISSKIMTKKSFYRKIIYTKMNTFEATRFLKKKLKKNIFYMGKLKKI